MVIAILVFCILLLLYINTIYSNECYLADYWKYEYCRCNGKPVDYNIY